MTRRTLVSFVLTMMAAMLVPVTALAETAPDFVKRNYGQLNDLLRKHKSAKNDSEVRSKVDDMLDYQTLAQRAMGKHWDELTEEDRRDYVSVLTQLVRRAYERDLRKTLDYDVTFDQAAAPARDGGLVVKSVARNSKKSREEPIRIDYLLHESGTGWRVYDIVTDGSSLVRTYQSQFSRIMRKDGFSELMRRLRKKLNAR